MSVALDRLIVAICERSIDAAMYRRTPPEDHDDCADVSFGDLKDVIGVELHAIKIALEALVIECQIANDWTMAAKIQAVARDL